MPDLVETGRNIAKIRRARGLTQKEAAFRANLSVNRWQDIEKGSKNITIDTLERIAKVLGVAPVTLGILAKPDEEILSIWHNTRQTAGIQGTSEIGRTIAELRKAKNITQAELSHRSKVSVARLRDIEHGCANVTMKVLARIASALGLSLLGLGMLTVSQAEILGMVYGARSIAEMAAV